jgi:hypothetical protein
MPPEVCPHCGADVPRKAKCCPECGADEATGWSESSHAANLGIPDDRFDYDEFLKDEFGGRTKPRGIHWLWWMTALILALLLLSCFLR